MKKCILAAVFSALILCACGRVTERDETAGSYRQVSQETAMEMMAAEEGYIILDVRTREEYAQGHIEGAICVPNEEIDGEPPAELPDKSQLIFVYCRSGNRSKQAAAKLFGMGYTNVVEFGGINTWPGAVVPGMEGDA